MNVFEMPSSRSLESSDVFPRSLILTRHLRTTRPRIRHPKREDSSSVVNICVQKRSRIRSHFWHSSYHCAASTSIKEGRLRIVSALRIYVLCSGVQLVSKIPKKTIALIALYKQTYLM